jgi:acyl-coenzyme A synthetase/AMP-(fatty) acid ligase
MPSIPDTLRTTAARCPDREALVFGAVRRTLTVEDLREWARDRIADYKAPHAVVVHAIPRNPSGKIQNQ